MFAWLRLWFVEFITLLRRRFARVGRRARAPRTVAAYFEEWIKQPRGQAAARADAQRLTAHVLPMLGAMPLRDVGADDVRRVFAGLKLAPRTVLATYGGLQRLFACALAAELVDRNPCVLTGAELPARADKDRAWRATAVFRREEAKQLLGSPLVPISARLLYAFGLLAGLREGEIAALRWCDIEAREPLAALRVHSSFSRANGVVKGTKTEQPRMVPVHPVLAQLLAEWRKLRSDTPEALVLTNQLGGPLTDHTVGRWLQRDLGRLGLRARRFHDTRRTFISLALSDGARKEVLRWVTHTGAGDVFDLYVTLPWPALCEAVSCLQLGPRPPSGPSAITLAIVPGGRS